MFLYMYKHNYEDTLMAEPIINESIRSAAYIGNKDAFLETGYQASIPINDNSKINVFGGFGTGFKNGADLNFVGYGQYSLNFGNSPGFFKFFSIKLYLTCEVV